MKDVPQDSKHHAEGDVWIHTRMVAKELTQLASWRELPSAQRDILFWSALMHDIAKPVCTEQAPDGRISAPRHARKGEFMAREILGRSGMSFLQREAICKLVRWHGVPLWSMIEKDVIRASLEVNLHHLSILAEADVKGRICTDKDELLERVEFFRLFAKELTCYSQPYPFGSDLARFEYFHKGLNGPQYVPYDHTWGEVVLMSGLPGAGKDTWIGKHGNDLSVIFLDEIRKALKISPTGNQGKVIQTARDQARVFLRQKQPFIWNGTNISRQIREGLISLFSEYKARVKIIYIEPEFGRILEQNRQREDVVPEKVIESLFRKLEVPSLTEAHAVEYYV